MDNLRAISKNQSKNRNEIAYDTPFSTCGLFSELFGELICKNLQNSVAHLTDKKLSSVICMQNLLENRKGTILHFAVKRSICRVFADFK